MQVRSLGYRTDLMVRRLAGSQIDERDDHIVVRTPQNPLFYWGNFVLVDGATVPGDVGRWLDIFADEFPEAEHVAIGIDGTHGWPTTVHAPGPDAGPTVDFGTVLAAAHLVPDASIVLTAGALSAPDRPPVDGDPRPLRTAGDWLLAVELRTAVGDAEGLTSPQHHRFLESTVVEARRLADQGYGTFFGNFADGELRSYLGVVSDGGPIARYQSVETHPDHRRRGLAGDLVHRAGLHGLEQRGAERLVIVADPSGPAIGLYRSLGFDGDERQTELLRTPHAETK